MIGIEELAVFCKKKGLIYPSSEIYGGLSGFFDYGPLGVELKNNIKKLWWKKHVSSREDIVGIDGSIICNPKIWKASGHVDCFEDVLVECKKCKSRFRGDVLLEEALTIIADGMKPEEIDKLITDNEIKCPKCKNKLSEASQFNLMFQTFIGPKQDDDAKAYLRPETAQIIFTNFRLIAENARLKLPFGIAQMGKSFRNEISPRNFLFRCREFEQMEIEYFTKPNDNSCPFLKGVEKTKINFIPAGHKNIKKLTVKEALNAKIIKNEWHAYWLAFEHQFFTDLGVNPNNLRARQHDKDELAHYSTDCWDLEYKFGFGWKELEGIADRGNYDLTQHSKNSGKDLSLYDEETKTKILATVVAEPSLGVERSFLLLLSEAYDDDKERGNIVLHLDKKIAPIQIAVFPLVNKINDKGREVFDMLKEDFTCFYDKSGSIGRRYARQDEIGTPICITVDFEEGVTIRDRDSTKQERIAIKDLKSKLRELFQ
ncbi:MAG: glycine--tRNA ligase [Nanoarchaeota archaeon]|nr:glycine--tRNA ligase [Nanoarchaeota archaeon]